MRTILVIDNDEEPMVAEFSIHDATMRTLKLQVSTPPIDKPCSLRLYLLGVSCEFLIVQSCALFGRQVQAQRAVELSRIHLFLNQQELDDDLLIRGSGVNYVHKRQVLRAFDPTQQMYYVHVRVRKQSLATTR